MQLLSRSFYRTEESTYIPASVIFWIIWATNHYLNISELIFSQEIFLCKILPFLQEVTFTTSVPFNWYNTIAMAFLLFNKTIFRLFSFVNFTRCNPILSYFVNLKLPISISFWTPIKSSFGGNFKFLDNSFNNISLTLYLYWSKFSCYPEASTDEKEFNEL